MPIPAHPHLAIMRVVLLAVGTHVVCDVSCALTRLCDALLLLLVCAEC